MSPVEALGRADAALGRRVGRAGDGGRGLRILLVARGYPPHGRFGSEFYTRELARGLARRGHAVDVVIPGCDVAPGDLAVDASVRVRALERGPRRRSLDASFHDEAFERAFARVLDELRPDVVHLTHLCWTLSARLPEIARSRSVPSVLTATDFGLVCHRGQLVDHAGAPCRAATAAACARCIREPGPTEVRPLVARGKRALAHSLAALGGLGLVATARDVERRRAALERAGRALARVIAPTRALRRVLLARGLPAREVVELGYAIDPAPYRRARRAPSERTLRIGFLSQFEPHKGIATLLAAARRLRRRGQTRGYTIDLWGLADDARQRRFARAILAPEDRATVRVRGAFEPDDAPAVLAGLAAVALPSEWCENAPLVALQARAAGVPIVGSDVPGVAEVVRDGRDGFLFPAGDAEALADRLTTVLRQGPLRVPAGLPLGYDEHLDRLERLYAELGCGSVAR